MQNWDVIVVGAGASGLTAARRAALDGASVLVVNKGLVGRSGATITSGGGISVSGEVLTRLGLTDDASDTQQDFFEDTIRAGYFLGDQRLVQSMVEEVGEALSDLLARGVKPKVHRRAPGHSSGRGVNISGQDLQKVVTTGALAAGVRFREDFQSAGLLSSDDGVCGVAGLDRRTGSAEALHAHTVILASGGATSNWRLRTAPEELTGDGQAMALEAGADLIEMEMLQFLPCCIIAPEIWRGLQFPWIIGPQAGVRAWLLNRYGERFMARWDPQNMELATRDVVSAASAAEVHAGRGSPGGGVYLSWAHLPRDIIENMPTWSKSQSSDWRWQGFDMQPLIARILSGHAIEVAPAAHFSLGGVRIDVDGRTGVPGLYACGEVSGGLHGGNRLSGNAGAQILVQGDRAGRAAAKQARKTNGPLEPRNWPQMRERILAPFERTAGIVPFEVKQRLSALAEQALGPCRQGARLDAALIELSDIRNNTLPVLATRSRDPGHNRDWFEALECRAGVDVLEAALLGARGRVSSIGAHHRLDSVTEPGGMIHSLVRTAAEGLEHRPEAVAFPLLSRAAA